MINYEAPNCEFSIHNGAKLFQNMSKMSVNYTDTLLLTFIKYLKCLKCLPFYINTLSVGLCLPRSVGKREVEIIAFKTFLFLNTECKMTYAPLCIFYYVLTLHFQIFSYALCFQTLSIKFPSLKASLVNFSPQYCHIIR